MPATKETVEAQNFITQFRCLISPEVAITFVSSPSTRPYASLALSITNCSFKMRVSLLCLLRLHPAATAIMASSSSKEPSVKKPVLYGYAKSSCSWRVRAAFAAKNADFECRYFNPYEATAEEKAQFALLNPLGQVPILMIDGHYLSQSVPILEYIEETVPGPRLLPKEPGQRAQVREIVELINSGIQPFQNPSVAQRHSDDPNKQKEWQVYWIEKGLTALEAVLTKTHGKCSVGDEITLADLCLVPQLFASRRFGANMTKFPLCVKIFDDLLELEPFRKTHPNNQADTPDESAPI
ncbi:putative maleylacetoacetate isomerase 1 [Hypsibius exemplaris]|uniref:maleylacetoacetate isomerase n=1 Tax=Hypsibius exemplaris TaxID=2072580 RepID=A0A1W0X5S3_HYPEX|nr:putative maleylacetoacetate isomerase 1 [Hypsibius exemplaris]